MHTIVAEGTWGITGPDFLIIYGALCAAAAIWIGTRWWILVGPPAGHTGDAMPDLGIYELAVLAEGTGLAVTSAAAQLHRDGTIKPSFAGQGALEVAGELDAAADAVEVAVYETIRDEPGISAHAMRERVTGSEAVQSMVGDLTRDGLLVEPAASRSLARGLLAVSGLLALLGIARIVAGVLADRPVAVLVVIVAAVVIGSVWLTAHVPIATSRGRTMLRRWRDAHQDLKSNPGGGDWTLAAALFGGAALWLAAPELASALEVEREAAAHGGSSGGGGGCGGGCGGCGGCGG